MKQNNKFWDLIPMFVHIMHYNSKFYMLFWFFDSNIKFFSTEDNLSTQISMRTKKINAKKKTLLVSNTANMGLSALKIHTF